MWVKRSSNRSKAVLKHEANTAQIWLKLAQIWVLEKLQLLDLAKRVEKEVLIDLWRNWMSGMIVHHRFHLMMVQSPSILNFCKGKTSVIRNWSKTNRICYFSNNNSSKHSKCRSVTPLPNCQRKVLTPTTSVSLEETHQLSALARVKISLTMAMHHCMNLT